MPHTVHRREETIHLLKAIVSLDPIEIHNSHCRVSSPCHDATCRAGQVKETLEDAQRLAHQALKHVLEGGWWE